MAAVAPRTIFKNMSMVSFQTHTLFGVKGVDINIDADYDTDGADNELSLQPYGVQNKTGTITIEAGDILDVVKAFSVGESGSMRGQFVAKYRGGNTVKTSASWVVASAWCQNIAVSGAYGDTGGVTATWGFNAGTLSWS